MLDNYDISWDQTTDPAALNTNPETYMKVSRDPERTPFQWSSDVNAGNFKFFVNSFILNFVWTIQIIILIHSILCRDKIFAQTIYIVTFQTDFIPTAKWWNLLVA